MTASDFDLAQRDIWSKGNLQDSPGKTRQSSTANPSQGAQLTVLGGQSTAQGSRLTSVETTVAGHTAAITGLQSQVSGVQGRVESLEKKSDNLTKGIAASMAMPSLSIPNGRKAAFGMDVSTYDGKQGVGASAAVALDKTWSVQGSIGGTFQGGDVGARAGVRAAW